MPRLTLSVLRQQYLQVEQELQDLQAKRRDLMKQVNKIDRRISSIKGVDGDGQPLKTRGGASAGGKAHANLLRDILSKKKGTFTIPDALKAFQDAVGATNSKEPGKLIGQNLSRMPEVHRVSRGVFKFVAAPKKKK